MKCGKERDMMVPPMGTVLTSEGSQAARNEMWHGMEVSVVIPCLNEANSVAHCVDKARKAFEAAGLCGEVVVADNGSTDGSIQIAEEHGARVIRVAERGYGAALRAGIAGSRGPFIIMGDADDSYDFSDVPRFVEMYRQGYDVIMGNRFRGKIKPGAMPWHHKYIGNPGLTALLNLFFHARIGDSHCGMRGFTRAIYNRMDLRSTGMEFASEFVIKAAQLGARMTEIPITLWADKRSRPPHLRSFRDGWRHLRFMLSFAKVFSYSERFDRGNISLKRVLKRVTLESGLLLGGALFTAGFAGCAWVTWRWAAGGFGELDEVRQLLFWAMWLFLGVQVIFASFFLSMLGISRGTYIGDYDLK